MKKIPTLDSKWKVRGENRFGQYTFTLFTYSADPIKLSETETVLNEKN